MPSSSLTIEQVLTQLARFWFDQTADITFSELFTAERTDTTAVVQANFTETYDSGGSRNFIGYWRLVLVDGRWLLDEPHY